MVKVEFDLRFQIKLIVLSRFRFRCFHLLIKLGIKFKVCGFAYGIKLHLFFVFNLGKYSCNRPIKEDSQGGQDNRSKTNNRTALSFKIKI